MIVVDINGTPHEIASNEQPGFDVLARQSGNRYLALASNDGYLFNPLNFNNNIHQRDRERGSKLWRLRVCSQECYLHYTAFLRSKNRTSYLLAQRRFRNDF